MFTLTVNSPELVAVIAENNRKLERLILTMDTHIAVSAMQLGTIAETLERQATALEGLYQLARWVTRPAKPQNLRAEYLEEVFMASGDMQRYRITADAPTDKDITKRHLKLQANDAVLVDADFPADTVDFGAHLFPQDANVSGVLTDFDDATPPNAAELPFDFVARDQQSPQTPAGIAVAFEGEVQADPTPPTTESPTTPTPTTEEPAPPTPEEPTAPPTTEEPAPPAPDAPADGS